jgi:hypothetical protein
MAALNAYLACCPASSGARPKRWTPMAPIDWELTSQAEAALAALGEVADGGPQVPPLPQ